MDYATYTIAFTEEGPRRVQLFSYLLGYSRRQYLHFVVRQDFDTTLRQHVAAFTHLGGVAATCLYDNFKVVVQGYEDDAPIYNPRFLAFATHYGFRPWACRPQRPQTKGKVERPFHYVETNLLCGRDFRNLEHLNDTTAWWLANVADVRVHGETKERPLDRHAQEVPHLLPLPTHPYDLAQVVYRHVSAEGRVLWQANQYSVPWRLIGRLLAVRITADELIVYGPDLAEVARHRLLPAGTQGQQSVQPEHQPQPNERLRRATLEERFAELGPGGPALPGGADPGPALWLGPGPAPAGTADGVSSGRRPGRPGAGRPFRRLRTVRGATHPGGHRASQTGAGSAGRGGTPSPGSAAARQPGDTQAVTGLSTPYRRWSWPNEPSVRPSR